MEVVPAASQGANGHISSPNPTTRIDPEVLLKHLVNLLRVTLEASTEDLEAKGSILSDARRSDTLQRCLRFTSDSQVVLYVQKDAAASAVSQDLPNGHNPTGKPQIKYWVNTTLTQMRRTTSTLHLLPILRDFELTFNDCIGCPDQTPTTVGPSTVACCPDTNYQSSRRSFVA